MARLRGVGNSPAALGRGRASLARAGGSPPEVFRPGGPVPPGGRPRGKRGRHFPCEPRGPQNRSGAPPVGHFRRGPSARPYSPASAAGSGFTHETCVMNTFSEADETAWFVA